MHTNFAMMQHHRYSLSELESMIPWEREVYVELLLKHIKDENKRIKEEQAKQQVPKEPETKQEDPNEETRQEDPNNTSEKQG